MGNDSFVVGITDFVTPPIAAEETAFPEAEFRFLMDWRDSDAARCQWQECDALLVWHFPVDDETAQVVENCRIVVRYGAGYDVLDVPSLLQNNIHVSNTPGCGTTEVADTTCAMILLLQRKISAYDRACRTQTDSWQQVLPPIRRTATRTLGVIGAGRVGIAVMERMQVFGCNIVFYDPLWPQSRPVPEGWRRVESTDALLSSADTVTIHCPLTEETRGMVNADFIAKMKPGASLVNAARGGVVADLDCVEEGLRSGRLASVAMDVLPQEPPQDHSLLRAWRDDEPWLAGRLIITPHVADYSEDGWYEVHYKAAETARLFLVDGEHRFAITA